MGAFPALFPKYFSVNRIKTTEDTGRVLDITINYTIMEMTIRDRVKIPYGILEQGHYHNKARNYCEGKIWTRGS